MAEPVSIQELLISNLAQTDAVVDVLIETGLVTREEMLRKINEHRDFYQRLLNPARQ